MIWILVVFLVVQVDERQVLDVYMLEIGTHEECRGAGAEVEALMTVDGVAVSWWCRPAAGD